MLVGGLGQIGRDLLEPLRFIYGDSNILVTDLFNKPPANFTLNYEQLDALNKDKYEKIANNFKPSAILHLSALLSGIFTRKL